MDSNVLLLLTMEIELDIDHISILFKLNRNEQETTMHFFLASRVSLNENNNRCQLKYTQEQTIANKLNCDR